MEDDEEGVGAAFDQRFLANAKALVERAIRELTKGYTALPRIDALRRDRADRTMRVLTDPGVVEAIVAEWLTAKDATVVASRDLKDVTKQVTTVARQAQALEVRLSELSADLISVLRWSEPTADGADVSQTVWLASIDVAAAAENLVQVATAMQQLVDQMPPKLAGRAGLLGILRELPPDNRLALKLGRLWLMHGLTLNGGEAGDGLDVFLAEIMGGDIKKSTTTLGVARKHLSS